MVPNPYSNGSTYETFSERRPSYSSVTDEHSVCDALMIDAFESESNRKGVHFEVTTETGVHGSGHLNFREFSFENSK
jgi:hypothetical protein